MATVLGELLYKVKADTAGLDSGIAQSEGRVQGFGSKLGSMIPTALIIAAATKAGQAIINLGNDAIETESKFSVVFSNVAKDAEKAVEELNKSYGMARLTAREMLSGTGDILSGFGFGQEQALEFSTNIAKISTDIASFKNVQGGAARVNEAVTKAMLGEREMLKTLGIAILEEDVKTQMLKESKQGLVYETERQAKAAATYNLIIEKSANAQGDFARTVDSNANQIRVLQETLKDTGAEIGKEMAPAVSDVLQAVNEALPKILGIIEPMIPLFVKAGKIIGEGIKLAGNIMEALGPLVDIVAGFAGGILDIIGGAVEAVNDAIEEARAFNDVLTEASNTMGITVDQGSMLYDNLVNAKNSGIDLNEHIAQLAENTGVSREEIELFAYNMDIAVVGAAKVKETQRLTAVYAQQAALWGLAYAEYQAGGAKQIAAIKKEIETVAVTYEDLFTAAGNVTKQLQEEINHRNKVNDILDKKLTKEEQASNLQDDINATAEAMAKLLELRSKEGAYLSEASPYYQELANKLKELKKEYAELTDNTEEWSDEMKQALDIYNKYGVSTLENIGKALVEGGDVWQVLRDSAVNAIADILEGLGQQFIIESIGAFANGNLVAGGLYAAGSAAAYIGAGAVRALANNQEAGAGAAANAPTGGGAESVAAENQRSSDRQQLVLQMDDGSKLTAFINREIQRGNIITA